MKKKASEPFLKKGGRLIMEYKVPVTFIGWGTVRVEAENKEALLEKLKDKNFLDELPLPDDWEYVDDSYKVDFDGLEMFNEHKSTPEKTNGK